MNGKIDWSELFFSADGRVGRLPFLVAGSILILLLTVYAQFARAMGPFFHWGTGVVAYPLFVFTAVCALSKRLHDRGRSGWWSLVTVIAFALAWPFRFDSFWQLIGSAFLVWAFVELALMPGEQGSNRFGPNPQRPPAASPA
jgi:uncharacterized membrane protein YhaH (DUF805 family)